MKQTQIVKFTLAVAIATVVSALSLEAAMTAQERKQFQARMEKKLEAECSVDDDHTIFPTKRRITYACLANGAFVVHSHTDNPKGYVIASMCFPEESEKTWYAPVVECTERLKHWIRVSQVNKIKRVEKKFPNICTRAILSHRKASTVDIELLPSGFGLVEFQGSVRANAEFNIFEVSISAIGDEYFDREIFIARGSVEAIEEKIDEFLMLVNPKTLFKIHKKKLAERTMFQ